MLLACLLLVAILLLQAAQYRRYGNQAKAIRMIAKKNIGALLRPDDHLYELAAMLSAWLEITLALALASLLPSWAGIVLAAPLIASRFRALQEIGHSALHQGFGERRELQWQIADWLGNLWLFKPNSATRFQGHCVEHHPHANTEKDPNIRRMQSIGFVPGMNRWRFRIFLFHPLTWHGMQESVALYRGAMGKGAEPWIRCALQGALLAQLFLACGAWACVAWLLALCLFYPLFSWWSLLAEHRWFAPGRLDGEGTPSRRLHDCEVTPRTDYSGVSAVLIRYFISPCTDSRHLAHHIYPRLHWRYLHLADKYLMKHEPSYQVHTRTSIFGGNYMSIVFELEQRFTIQSEIILNHVNHHANRIQS